MGTSWDGTTIQNVNCLKLCLHTKIEDNAWGLEELRIQKQTFYSLLISAHILFDHIYEAKHSNVGIKSFCRLHFIINT